jgi:hypothetical protein
MKKKGISAVVATVMIILIVVVGVGIIWRVLTPFFEEMVSSESVKSEMLNERFSVSYVGGSGKDLEVVINRGATKLTELSVENVTVTVNTVVAVPTDIMLLMDLSGSMGPDYPPIDCIKSDTSLNYQGSYCDSSQDACENPLGSCLGNYAGEICSNPIGSDKDDNCIKNTVFCRGNCLGDPIYPIDVLNRSATEFVDNIMALNSDTKIALLGFAGSQLAGFRFPYLGFKSDADVLKSEINQWYANGGTPLYGGLQTAFDKYNGRTAENKLLIVLGDGDVTDVANDEKYIVMEYAKNFPLEGINVSTIGFGPAANTALFQGIAGNGSGLYYDSSEFNNLAERFDDIVGNTEITRLVGEEISVPGVFMDIAISAGGNSYVHRILRDLPGSNAGKKYTIDLTPLDPLLNVEDVTKVEIYFIVVSEGAKENSVFMGKYEVD